MKRLLYLMTFILASMYFASCSSVPEPITEMNRTTSRGTANTFITSIANGDYDTAARCTLPDSELQIGRSSYLGDFLESSQIFITDNLSDIKSFKLISERQHSRGYTYTYLINDTPEKYSFTTFSKDSLWGVYNFRLREQR